MWALFKPAEQHYFMLHAAGQNSRDAGILLKGFEAIMMENFLQFWKQVFKISLYFDTCNS